MKWSSRRWGVAVVSAAVGVGLTVTAPAGASPKETPATAVAAEAGTRPAVTGPSAVRDGGVWYFRAKHSGKCLTVHGASTARGAAVDQYTCLGRANQRWRLLHTNQWGLAYIVSENGGKCLDVQGGSKANGAKFITWDCNSRKNQTFHVRNLTGHMAIKPLHISTKCLDIPGASQKNNTRAVLWSCKGVANQQFKPVRA
ncbi:RICIN domain-containing protein [Streptomyces kanasensis]|uniref:RICIN domain-containing protein n=1 Tax=Streptomyces kanasensis TaxID=936756 RepID=UPI0036F5D1A6